MQMKTFLKNIWRRFDFSLNYLTWLEFGLLLLVWPLMQWANPALFVEDGMVENIQLLVLIAAILVAWRAKNNRELFIFAAFVLLFMILRETNLFRGYFCSKYQLSGLDCRWSSFQYGWIASAVRWLLVAVMVVYATRHKLWQPIWNYVMKAPIFVWDLLILGLTIIGGTVAEFSFIDNEIMEECCELISYIALANCVYRYQKLQIK